MDNIEVIIHRQLHLMTVEVYLRQQENGKVYIIGYDGDLLVKQLFDDQNPEVQEFKPLLKLPDYMLDTLMKSFAEELSSKGYRTKNENHIEGKLQATETHLADMREFSKQMLNKITERVGESI
jgi:hypothetical protein